MTAATVQAAPSDGASSQETTAAWAQTDRGDQVRLWDNANIVESFPELTLPLTFSIAVELYADVYRQACRALGVPSSVVERERDLFEQMLGLLEGRVYYNLTSWYRVLALLPGFGLTAGFLEAMMGAARPGAAAADRSAAVTGNGAPRWELAPALVRLGIIWARHDAAVARFRSRIGLLLERYRDAPSAASAEELLAEFEQFRRRALRDWRTPIMNDFLLMLSHGALRRLAARWLGRDAPRLVNAMLAQGSAASARPARELLQIASAIRARSDWYDVVLSAPPADLRARLAAEDGIPGLAASIDDYLGAWGGRAPRELQLDRPSYRDDPVPLMGALQALVRDLPPPPHLAHAEASRSVRERLGARPFGALRAGMLMALVRTVRRQIRWREELRLLRGGVFDVGRRIFRRLGVVLAAQGRLERPDDVHYLSLDELRGMVRGTGVAGDARALVEARRRRYAGYASRSPLPSRLETRGIVADPLSFVPVATADRTAPRTAPMVSLRGIGAAHGRVRARCLVILDPALSSIESGRIIAARSTDPGWVPLLAGAAGLLVEQGSLLSHSAIVARELGIPTVVGLQGLLDVVRTGDLIELDGSTGEVTLLAGPGGGP
jgi:pyruvate,water dikinase